MRYGQSYVLPGVLDRPGCGGRHVGASRQPAVTLARCMATVATFEQATGMLIGICAFPYI